LTEERVLLLIANAMTTHTAQMEAHIIAAIDEKFDSRFGELSESVEAMHDVFEKHIDEAFPDGPLLVHKLDHEGRNKWSEIKQRLGVDLIRYTLLGAVAFVFGLLGLGALQWIQRGIHP
jgi:hypothetical protein